MTRLARMPRLDTKARPVSRQVSAILLFSGLIVAIACCSEATAAKRKPRRKGGKPSALAPQPDPTVHISAEGRFNETVRRYLPEDCRAFGWIDVKPVLNSAIGAKLTHGGLDFAKECEEKFGPLQIRPDQIDCVVYGGKRMEGNGISEMVAVVFCNQSIPVPVEGSEPPTSAWATIEVGSQKLWVKDGESPWAACRIDERIALVGHPTHVGEVLSRREGTRLPAPLDAARLAMNPAVPFAVAFLPSEPLDGNLIVPFPTTGNLSTKVNAVSMEADFDDQMNVAMTAFCQDEESAKQLHSLAIGMTAMIQLQEMEDQPPELQQLLQSLRLDLQGNRLTAQIKVPASLAVVQSSETASVAPASGLSLFPVQQAHAVPATAGYSVAPPETCPNVPQATPVPVGTPAPYPSTCPPPTAMPYPTPYSSSYGAGPYGPTTCPDATKRARIEVADVLRLTEAGVEEPVIINHIHNRCLTAELTVDDLIDLTKAEVSVNVITTLQGLPVQKQATSAESQPVGPAPTSSNRQALGNQASPT